MASSARSELRCPLCGITRSPDGSRTPVTGKPRHFPFCSERCQLVDLGKWLDEDYRIPGEPVRPPDAGPGPDES